MSDKERADRLRKSLQAKGLIPPDATAPVEGLETVEPLYGPKINICWTQDNTPKEHRKIVQLMAEGDYVTRSQAEAIIATVRADYAKLVEQTIQQQKQIEKLEADNAALTARVKELEGKLKTGVPYHLGEIEGCLKEYTEMPCSSLYVRLIGAIKTAREALKVKK